MFDVFDYSSFVAALVSVAIMGRAACPALLFSKRQIRSIAFKSELCTDLCVDIARVYPSIL